VSITRPLGFRAAATTAGIKPSGKPDLALIVCDDPPRVEGTPRPYSIDSRRTAAAVFTRNAVVGAPVEIGREWRSRAVKGQACLRAILINAGCSNAATGQPGIDDARTTMRAVSELLGKACHPDEVMPSSTGVIGHRLPVDKITRALPTLVQKLARGEEADEAAAAAIMTTDLVPKMAHKELEIGGKQVHLGAIGKGSGMIAPQMDSVGPQATMLGFITTDAAVAPMALQHALEDACRESFDRISVDAHPSCSDSVFVMASGMAGGTGKSGPIKTIHDGEPEYFAFRSALTAICQSLATKVVRDGEGVTRTFRVEVKGAADAASAEKMARAVVDSPLVKCAIHGKDPNWGRIVTAAGNAGIRFDTREASLTIGEIEVYRAGVPTGIGKTDPKLMAAMNADPVLCTLTVGHGQGRAWMLGCDLSAEYVRINAEYTT
jgi:glutamate N-acetyltransferase/amino-acid N-acetyltransferase